MTATKHDRPADTTIMGVVHDALRRDLRRLDLALAEPESERPPERRGPEAVMSCW